MYLYGDIRRDIGMLLLRNCLMHSACTLQAWHHTHAAAACKLAQQLHVLQEFHTTSQ
jgi:hypothetical protein